MKGTTIRKMVLCSLFASLMAICSWIALPMGGIVFTLQTFAVFLSLGILGGKWGTVSILLYLALGTAGLPVFSGFRGGIGVLLGVTGGYLWGFLTSGLTYWAFEKLCRPAGMIAGLGVCYLCGCLWFAFYSGGAGFRAAVLSCVVPYLIPDGVKLYLAFSLSRRLKKHLKY